ncbi:hypothetical protein [Niveibacterium sp. SC-1]|uniref:hypothetical protein n=1 Tax=Niveibacterium sp. SC-1 TaxID=3135646 RepID=UPI00311F6EA1
MALFAINALHQQNGYVTRVRWGLVDPLQETWLSDPEEADVLDVLNALRAGHTVCVNLARDGSVVPGDPVHQTAVSGMQSIATEDEDPSLHGLPRF